MKALERLTLRLQYTVHFLNFSLEVFDSPGLDILDRERIAMHGVTHPNEVEAPASLDVDEGVQFVDVILA